MTWPPRGRDAGQRVPLDLIRRTISHHLKTLADTGIFTRDERDVWAC
jgi:hypothetical protein